MSLYEEMIQREFQRALALPVDRYKQEDIACYYLRADLLPAAVKTPIGTCLVAHFIDQGLINSKTEAVIVQGSGNTAKAVRLALNEFIPHIRVVAVVYQETSSKNVAKLEGCRVEVVRESPFYEGRLSRQRTVDRLASYSGWIQIEQHEQPLIIDIQERTLGRALVVNFNNLFDCFVTGIGTGGTLFGIGKALRSVNSGIRIYGMEGVGSTVTLWHAYLKSLGQSFETQKLAVEIALDKYKKAGMVTSLKCYPDNPPEAWFDVQILTADGNSQVAGIEGLGVGEPTELIKANLRVCEGIVIVEDYWLDEDGVKKDAIQPLGIKAGESAIANSVAVHKLRYSPKNKEGIREGNILTIVTS